MRKFYAPNNIIQGHRNVQTVLLNFQNEDLQLEADVWMQQVFAHMYEIASILYIALSLYVDDVM